MSRQREAYPPKTSSSGRSSFYRERLQELRSEELARQKKAEKARKDQARGIEHLNRTGN